MITLQDSQIQSRLCTYMRIERPYTLAANDAGVMKIVDYDLSEAEKHLNSSKKRNFLILLKTDIRNLIYMKIPGTNSERFC